MKRGGIALSQPNRGRGLHVTSRRVLEVIKQLGWVLVSAIGHPKSGVINGENE